MGEPARKPTAWWYGLAAAIIVVGCGASVFYGCGAAKDSIAAMDRVVVPGEHDIHLDSGRTSFFYEPRSRAGGVGYSTPETIAGLTCTLAAPGGKPISLNDPSIEQTYSLGGFTGRSEFAADIEEAGTYHLACAYAGEPGPQVVLAVGDGFSVGSILLAIIGVAGSIFIAVPIMVITLIRRRSRVRPVYTVR